jgi:hypothetical protein
VIYRRQIIHMQGQRASSRPEPHEIPRLGLVGEALELVTAMLKDVIIAAHPNIDLDRLAWIGNYVRLR